MTDDPYWRATSVFFGIALALYFACAMWVAIAYAVIAVHGWMAG